jgi:hypothetical protein
MYFTWVGSWPFLQTYDYFEKAWLEKYSSLLLKFVNHGRKSFITPGPGVVFTALHFLRN